MALKMVMSHDIQKDLKDQYKVANFMESLLKKMGQNLRSNNLT